MGDPCILVIDDEAAIAELIGDFCESMGYSVKTVTDSRDALRMAKEFRPHLITLDLQMPEVDGFELLRRFKADPDTADIRHHRFGAGAGGGKAGTALRRRGHPGQANRFPDPPGTGGPARHKGRRRTRLT